MEASEVYFLRAEGALRGWPNMGGTAEELYNKGIRASLKARTDATDQEIKNYIHSTSTPAAPHSKDGGPDAFNSPPVSNIPVIFETNASFETKLEQIITQKWIALYPDAWEAWAERRRTGYPRGYAIIKSNNPNISSTQLVRRIKYPPSEYDTNAKAVKAAVDSLLGGPDQANTRLWWDAKPLADYPTPTDPIQ
jgi:tetrahydromethanopterin S-methyltransferase subunit F